MSVYEYVCRDCKKKYQEIVPRDYSMLRFCFTLLMSGFLIACGRGEDRGQTTGD